MLDGLVILAGVLSLISLPSEAKDFSLCLSQQYDTCKKWQQVFLKLSPDNPADLLLGFSSFNICVHTLLHQLPDCLNECNDSNSVKGEVHMIMTCATPTHMTLETHVCRGNVYVKLCTAAWIVERRRRKKGVTQRGEVHLQWIQVDMWWCDTGSGSCWTVGKCWGAPCPAETLPFWTRAEPVEPESIL